MDWHRRGGELFAGGITHQTRFTSPFAVYIESGRGPFKYDIDGNELVDYVMGNGSLLMGHSPAEVTEAVAEQAARGTHLGGATSHEIRYAEAVKRLMPSLERVRFTTSGTESTYLALRLARAHTGKTKIVKFREHFPRLARLRYAGIGAGARRSAARGSRYRNRLAGGRRRA